jgi:7-carboxy-7-deazaguanine synthase
VSTVDERLPKEMTGSLLVSEIFGPTFQGEGPSVGQRCTFIRFGGCNLHCSWCDTPYTWDWTRFDPKVELKRMTLVEVEKAVAALDGHPRTIVLTGGEPLLQKQLRNLMVVLYKRWPVLRIEVETNGTIVPPFSPAMVSQFNVSPKLNNSGNTYAERTSEQAMEFFTKDCRSIFKFVVRDMDDLLEVKRLQSHFNIPSGKIYIMPEGTDASKVEGTLRTLADEVLKCRYNLTTRLQVLLWGNERKR